MFRFRDHYQSLLVLQYYIIVNKMTHLFRQPHARMCIRFKLLLLCKIISMYGIYENGTSASVNH